MTYDTIKAAGVYHMWPEMFTIHYEVYSHRVEFEVYNIMGFQQTEFTGKCDTPMYEAVNARSSDDTTIDIADAEIFIKGWIKWDGCSDWDFCTTDCMMHACDSSEMIRLGDLFQELYRLTDEKLDSYVG